MTIKRLKELRSQPERTVTPQCCVKIEETEYLKREKWRQNRYMKLRPHFDPELCQRESTVNIDGKYYCHPHAGQLALKWWLEGKLKQKAEPPKDEPIERASWDSP